MDCAQFEELLHDLDRAGTQAAASRECALAHAESCSRCARLVTESEALDFSLRTLAHEDAGQRASARLEENLLREFRRAKAAASRRRMAWRVVALGAAAGVALAVGISLRHTRAPGAKSTVIEQAGTVQPAPAQGNAAPTADQKPAANQQAPADRQDDSEYATDFVPLPYADDSAMADGGAVVRVVLSRSALASLGAPVVDTGDSNLIPADLVVSEDGTPQAIRLVAEASVN